MCGRNYRNKQQRFNIFVHRSTDRYSRLFAVGERGVFSTLAVELDEPLLVLGQLGPARHLVDLPLQDGDLTVPPSLKAAKEEKF